MRTASHLWQRAVADALASIGGIVVPIYPTSSAVECVYILGNSGARVIVWEDAAQHAKIAPARRELEALEQVIVVEGSPPGTLALEQVREGGRAHLRDRPGELEVARAGIGEEDVLTIVYTSGTTGPPKGCVLTHRNYAVMTAAVRRVKGLFEPGDRALLHLPLAHTFARLVQFLGADVGFTIAFCPDVTRLPKRRSSTCGRRCFRASLASTRRCTRPCERASRRHEARSGGCSAGRSRSATGRADADGFLTITDRKKDLIVTAGGKKISPQNIERASKSSRYVPEALVVGDRRPYVVALVTLDREEVDRAAPTDDDVHALAGRVIDDVNRDLGLAEQVRRFAILPREFEQERAELTPTLKLRRRVCEEHFRAEIDRFYTGSPGQPP